jgi:hypothetical protein
MSALKSQSSSWRRATPSGQQCGQPLTRTRSLICWLWVTRCQVRRRWLATGSHSCHLSRKGLVQVQGTTYKWLHSVVDV